MVSYKRSYAINTYIHIYMCIYTHKYVYIYIHKTWFCFFSNTLYVRYEFCKDGFCLDEFYRKQTSNSNKLYVEYLIRKQSYKLLEK